MVKIRGTEFFLGSDPEVFLMDRDGNLVPAPGVLPGTKEEPLEIPDGMVQVDGLAIEFGVAPCRTREEFVQRHLSVMETVQSMLPDGLYLDFSKTTAVFPQEVLDKQPPENLILGCEPDYNAYTGKKNPSPKLPHPGFRTVGGHVHVGMGLDIPMLDPEHLSDCALLALCMDFTLGLPSLAWDSDQKRRTLYGSLGSFRPKPYGMEYRPLSNQWLRSPELIGTVWDLTVVAIGEALSGGFDVSERVRQNKLVFSNNDRVTSELMLNIFKQAREAGGIVQ